VDFIKNQIAGSGMDVFELGFVPELIGDDLFEK